MSKNLKLFIVAVLMVAAIVMLAVLLSGRSSIPFEGGDDNAMDGGKDFEDVDYMAGDVIRVEERCLEPTFNISLKYDKYITTYTYMFVETDLIDVYSGPDRNDEIVSSIPYGERLNYLETVYIAAGGGQIEEWHHVAFSEEEETRFGFITGLGVIERWYQFDKMKEAITDIEAHAEKGKLTYISNYKNINGDAPLINGKSIDRYGKRRSMSAPGYISLSNLEDLVYLEDGTLVQLISADGDYAKVVVVATGGEYFVPQKYIPKDHLIHDFSKAIVVDVTNQNEAALEKELDEWTLIAYTQATTGTTGRYSQPTPTGFYFGIEKRPYFRYYEDGTTRIQGYAPYAIRFAGGAYVHGIPVNYKYGEDGSVITPPHQEYSKTVGTVPLSHKCVRNYTSHAKFLYDWFVPGETIVIVID
jgi:hypothetical protein